MIKKKVSILGCGWTGNALYKKLISKYEVNCLCKDIEENDRCGFYDVDVLVIAIPAKNNYLEVLKQTLQKTYKNTYIILLSSISFYKNRTIVVDAEKLIQKESSKYVILRLGGLMGYDRISGKYTAGKTLDNNTVTNYVHRDDVVSVIETLTKKQIENEIFDVVAPIQSTQKEIFSLNANRFGFEKTSFLDDNPIGKKISSLPLIEKTGYKFKKNNVLDFW
ncbi:hypothetical protein CRV00_01500 [Malaciobacter molluscorum]|uniref:hypothetical protein n=1 Tax=Malaciobacter molluscorum TaxID=1032072 RepID=UPI00100B8640|nr:hypothetical protein [Malaciobacter molluscorum]RXJ96324.1 hypothetical protein CRV00_01500 [Malaciobacter molluscorum]